MKKACQYSYRQRDKARELRHRQTDAEKALWNKLRALRLEGYKFRRQHPIGKYIADFCCMDSKTIIELDGGQHCENKKDVERDTYLTSLGFRVVRFWNNESTENMEGLLQALSLTLSQRERGLTRNKTNSLPPPPLGEGWGEGQNGAKK
jgi:very-short-patch-repair endonuclease